MEIFVGIIVGLIVLMVLVVAHEFGHFLMSRKNGVNVLEFGIGFPPRAVAWVKDPKTHKWRRLKKSEWDNAGIMKTVLEQEERDAKDAKDATSKKKATTKEKGSAAKAVTSEAISVSAKDKKFLQDGMVFSINWLPIGGFCQMDGESATDERAGTFGHASFWSKTKILFGGVAMNWLVAWIILTVLAWTGMPTFLSNQFTVESDTRVEESSEIATVTKDEEGNEVRTPQKIKYSTWSAPIVGAGVTLQMTGETFKGVGELVWNLVSGVGRLFSFDSNVRESGQEAISAVGDSVSGPVGIIGVLFPSFTSAGPANLAFLTAVISISLACMNVLPIPALDGGRWLLIAIYKLRRKRLTKETEQKIVARAMYALLALMAIVTILDITRFF